MKRSSESEHSSYSPPSCHTVQLTVCLVLPCIQTSLAVDLLTCSSALSQVSSLCCKPLLAATEIYNKRIPCVPAWPFASAVSSVLKSVVILDFIIGHLSYLLSTWPHSLDCLMPHSPFLFQNEEASIRPSNEHPCGSSWHSPRERLALQQAATSLRQQGLEVCSFAQFFWTMAKGLEYPDSTPSKRLADPYTTRVILQRPCQYPLLVESSSRSSSDSNGEV
ncbi:hypothetical protein QQF64_026178 [Cirrhinus molitorella]|uniref:Uncharacterized protein n=1 Tax=Cirrhinus molitorella TaxID=172907 RepID=A0ABR3NSI1_9TELE